MKDGSEAPRRRDPARDPARDPGPRAVPGKTLILGVLGALVVVVGLLFWAGMTGGSAHVPQSAPGVGFTVDDAAVAGPAAPDAARGDR